MLTFVLGCITPLLIAGGITDPQAARAAAQQAIEAHAGTPLHAGQAVAFALASLDSLRLSAPDTVPIPMKLKLRGNANALNQTATRHATATPAEPAATAVPDPSAEATAIEALTATESLLSATQTPTNSNRKHELAWANAMLQVAAEQKAGLAKLPPHHRQQEIRRIATLSAAAKQIISGVKA